MDEKTAKTVVIDLEELKRLRKAIEIVEKVKTCLIVTGIITVTIIALAAIVSTTNEMERMANAEAAQEETPVETV